MDIREMYRHIIEDTDPNDPVVAEEINKAMRQSDGITDIQAHLPLLRGASKGNVMEIGVHWGISTVALLLGVEEKGGHLWSVDVNDCRILEHPQWTFIQADSVKDFDIIKRAIPSELDLLLIDGDHSFDTVLSDLVNYASRSREILLHDYEMKDVSDAVAVYRMEGSKQKHINRIYESHGLAVLS